MGPRLSTLTTLRLGGPAERVLDAADEAALIAAVTEADAAGESLLVLAGGSNLVVADEGLAGTVVLVRSRGVTRTEAAGRVVVEVAAGEPWDDLVKACVDDGLAGLEALSGIPGSTGATPIQNVGAYGQEVADTITGVRVLDRSDGTVRELAPEECGFAYRSSSFKREPGRSVVLSVRFALERRSDSAPVRYAELARTLGVDLGERAPLPAVRRAVLALRRAKGMVLDENDPDTRSAGSFFTNPILSPEAFDALRARAAKHSPGGAQPPGFPEPDGRVKTSAAWLIEGAGFARGHGDPHGIAISGKHVLALTNRGSGTTAQLVALARSIAAAVQETFGVALVPEPVFAGHAWATSARPS